MTPNKSIVIQMLTVMGSKGYTARDVATKMNKSQREINAILSERKAVTMRFLAEFCKAMDCVTSISCKPNVIVAA